LCHHVFFYRYTLTTYIPGPQGWFQLQLVLVLLYVSTNARSTEDDDEPTLYRLKILTREKAELFKLVLHGGSSFPLIMLLGSVPLSLGISRLHTTPNLNNSSINTFGYRVSIEN
jgi:hypothetical protein